MHLNKKYKSNYFKPEFSTVGFPEIWISTIDMLKIQHHFHLARKMYQPLIQYISVMPHLSSFPLKNNKSEYLEEGVKKSGDKSDPNSKSQRKISHHPQSYYLIRLGQACSDIFCPILVST